MEIIKKVDGLSKRRYGNNKRVDGLSKRRYGNNKRVGNCHILVIY
jgi:hypothetical protein